MSMIRPHPVEPSDDPHGGDVAVAELDTQVGRLAVACTWVGVAAVGWGSAHALADRHRLSITHAPERTTDVLEQLRRYFRGQPGSLRIPLDWRLTRGVQRSVLQTLCRAVGYGRSITYGELAQRCDGAVPARAVGGIMGSNPLPLVVPCHRVLAHDGLGGYSGGGGAGAYGRGGAAWDDGSAAAADANHGRAVKRWLLALEGALPPTLDWCLEQGPAGEIPAPGWQGLGE